MYHARFRRSAGLRVSAAALAAVGVLGTSSMAGAQTLTWSTVPSPSPGVVHNFVNGVSCTSASACTAVGYYSTSRLTAGTLVESWDGTGWSAVPSPSPGSSNDLNGASCVSASACTAVGVASTASGSDETLIESLDGTSWSVAPSPSPGFFPQLDSVSCTSMTACTAVGYDAASGAGVDYQTLIESWDGTSWSVVPSPSPGTDNFLYGVWCVSANVCTAVGSYNPSTTSGGATLIESWDGTSWSVVPSASPMEDSQLHGVSCASATACMAVGYYFISGTNHRKTLIESWNGTSWAWMPSPSPGHFGQLDGVSCITAAACSAVGDYVTSGGEEKTLIESWNGTSWSRVPSPSPGTGSQLSAVSCASATACTAAGSRRNSKGHDRTLIETGPAS